MSAATPPPPRGIGRGLAVVMAVVLYLALIVFAYGMISLLLDRDVIDDPDAGPLVGPFMVVVACAVVLWFTLRERPRRLWARSISAALSAVILGPAAGAILFASGIGEPGALAVFFGRYLLSPFVLASAILAALVVGGAGLLRRR